MGWLFSFSTNFHLRMKKKRQAAHPHGMAIPFFDQFPSQNEKETTSGPSKWDGYSLFRPISISE
jgi:hypothetical protein